MPPPYLLRSNLGGREGRGAALTPSPLWLDMGGREGRGGEPAVAAASGLHLPAGSRKEGERKGGSRSEGSVASAADTVTPLLRSDLGVGREGEGKCHT